MPTYALYEVQHKGQPALVVLPGRDDRNAPNRLEFRKNPGHRSNDADILRAFVALSSQETGLQQVVRFITRYGHLGNDIGILPEALIERFGDFRVPFHDFPGRLIAGTGSPEMRFEGETRLVTVQTFQRPACLVVALLAMDSALRGHGKVRWASYARRRDIRDARETLASFGFGGANVRALAELDRTPPPTPLDDPGLDDYALYLAKYGGPDAIAHSGPFVEVTPGRFERAGPSHPETQIVANQLTRWRAYWAALERIREGPPLPPAVEEQFQKRSDAHATETAAKWFIYSADLRAELEGEPGGFALRYTPVNAWQAIALAAGRQLTATDGLPLRTCRFCGLPFVSSSNSLGGRPRTLCGNCYTPRLAKTIAERFRRRRGQIS